MGKTFTEIPNVEMVFADKIINCRRSCFIVIIFDLFTGVKDFTQKGFDYFFVFLPGKLHFLFLAGNTKRFGVFYSGV